jgi:beta-lactam-binding protein with PASTA domain
MRYVVIQVENKDVPQGMVFDQSPAPDTQLGDDESVTLVVSRGGQ